MAQARSRATAAALSAGVLATGGATVLPAPVALAAGAVLAVVLVDAVLPARPATRHHRSPV